MLASLGYIVQELFHPLFGLQKAVLGGEGKEVWELIL